MVAEEYLQTSSPAIFDHELNQYFPELLKFDSTEEMEKSAVYQKIKREVEQILNSVVQENFAPETSEKTDIVRALAWNIERGNRFAGIVLALAKEDKPDTSHYTDEEIVYRVKKPKHIGLIFFSEKQERVDALLNIYTERITNDFLAFAPAKERYDD